MKATASKPAALTRADISLKLDAIRERRTRLNDQIVARDKAVALVAAKYAQCIEDLACSICEIEAEIKRWALDHREAEFGTEKTLEFKSGATVQFRLGAKQIVFAAGKDEEKVIAALQKRKLSAFIRAKFSLNRAALLTAIGTKLLPNALAKTIGVLTEQKEAVIINVPLATAGKESNG